MQTLNRQEAAQTLNVSVEYLDKLIHEGKLKTFNEKLSKDKVVSFKNQRDQHRRQMLNELYAISEEDGLYEITDFPD